jgi:CNT family concentrative nucleoside transporter
MIGLQNAQSLTGIVLVMLVCWAFSEDRRRFPWKLALAAMAIQIGIVLLLFGLPQTRGVLLGIGMAVNGLASSTQAGSAFIFGYLAGGPQPYVVQGPAPYIFAFQVLPVILVVCGLSALLWHWGVLKLVTRGFGFVFQKTLGLRGPPALATAGTIFLGQVEGPIFISAYLDKLTRSELFTLMAVGLSCVSGSTMVAYATLLEPTLHNAAAHVLTASIISAPAGVLLSRILVPAEPTEAMVEGEPALDRQYASSIDAVIHGVGDGLTIALNVGATLIVFVAFTTMADKILGLLPMVGGAPISVERGLGIVFAPLAWTLGIPWKEAPQAGLLLGVKLVLTEFTAFIDLGRIPVGALSDRTRVIMTYALCGFANIASVGITVAGFSTLIPDRRTEVLGLAWKALLAGFLATCMTAAIVGAMPDALFHAA